MFIAAGGAIVKMPAESLKSFASACLIDIVSNNGPLTSFYNFTRHNKRDYIEGVFTPESLETTLQKLKEWTAENDPVETVPRLEDQQRRLRDQLEGL